MKIIIGVDDSPHSRAALDFAKRMKWPAGTRFLLVTACQPQVVVASMADAGIATWMQSAEGDRMQEHEELAARAEKDLRDSGLKTEARAILGDPREVLVSTAVTEGADMILVGSHGRTGLDKLLMGSVASHVVTHAPCTVVVVKLPR